MNVKRTLVFAALMGWSLFSGGMLHAQEQVAEADVNQQKLFIDASREKLLGNTEKAIELFQNILNDDKANHAAAYELGRLYYTQGNTEEAIRHLKMALEAAPDNEWYYKFLADVYQANNRNREGAALYEALVAKQPHESYLYFKWAYFLVKAQEIEQAIKVYNQLESRIGVNEEGARRKHTLYLGMGDNKRAARELERLIETYPKELDYRHLLASFYQSIGDEEQARRVFADILKVKPDDAKAQLALSGGQAAGRDELNYLASLRTVFERDDVGIDLKIGKLLPFITKVSETGDRQMADAALELTAALETVHPAEAKAFAAAGDLYYHSGRRAEAAAKYRQALTLDESIYTVWEQLLYALYETGDYRGLRKTVDSALDVFPNKVNLYYFSALANDALMKYDDALGDLDQALLMAGRNDALRAELLAMQGQVYGHQGQEARAKAAFEEAVKLNGKSPEVGYRYSQYLLQQGQEKEALKLAEAAHNAAPDNPYYLLGVARATYKADDYKAARGWAEKAFGQGAENWAEGQELYGDILFQQGEVEQALSHWTRARTIGGGSELLEKKINNRQLYE